MGMWTKLRPGVREFLRRAAERFELWIYTAGSKPYADVSVHGTAVGAQQHLRFMHMLASCAHLACSSAVHISMSMLACICTERTTGSTVSQHVRLGTVSLFNVCCVVSPVSCVTGYG